MDNTAFSLWCRLNNAPFHFPQTINTWERSMYADIDSDGRTLFADLSTESTAHAMIQYGNTAFGFNSEGDICADIHHPVIRFLCFEKGYEVEAQQLLDRAMASFPAEKKIWAFFHYFGMTACARHGKLHDKDAHIAKLLMNHGFVVEHENVYYSKTLDHTVHSDSRITLSWKSLSAGGCREFSVSADGREIGWGQVHFLPQGDIAYLRWIYIDSTRQHHGFGTAAMNTLFCELYSMGIRRFDTDTALDNSIAQRYYEKCGFTNEGITRSYYAK